MANYKFLFGALAFAVLAFQSIQLHAANIKAGQALAEAKCAKCHAIKAEGKSPFAQAPPLRTFAKKWPLESLEEAFAEGIMVGHPAMPEFEFEPEQIENLLSYIDSISQ